MRWRQPGLISSHQRGSLPAALIEAFNARLSYPSPTRMPVFDVQPDRRAEATLHELRLRFRNALVALLTTVTVSTIGFAILGEDQHRSISGRLFHGLWDTLNVVSTVGSLEPPFNPARQAWAMIVIVIGLGAVLYGFTTLQGLMHGGDVIRLYARRRMEKQLQSFSGHVILCGYGHVGREVARHLTRARRSVVVIEKSEAAASEADQAGLTVICGDCTDEQTLRTARAEAAMGLIAAVDCDEANVYLLLIARELNPKLRLVARAERPGSRLTLRRAGADRVIVPGELAAVQLSHLMLKPRASEFVQAAIGEGEFSFGELEVAPDSRLCGRSLGDVNLAQIGAIVIAAVDTAGNQEFNPGSDRVLQAGETLILVSREGGLNRIAELE